MQSVIENIPPHSAKLPPNIGALLDNNLNPPISLSLLGALNMPEFHTICTLPEIPDTPGCASHCECSAYIVNNSVRTRLFTGSHEQFIIFVIYLKFTLFNLPTPSQISQHQLHSHTLFLLCYDAGCNIDMNDCVQILYQIIQQIDPSQQMANVDIMRVQKEELDALNNIYLHDLQIHRSTFPIKFTIACQPFSYVHQDQYRTKIHIEFTKEYPASAPRLQIQPLVGITQDNILAMERKVDTLLSSTANRPLVYDLVEAVRDWIQEYLVEGKDELEQSKDDKVVEQVFERPKYQTFTPVTMETFTIWKKAFDLQMAELKKKKLADDEKLTGKQWFMKNRQIHQDSDQEDEEQEQEQKQVEIQ